MRVIAAILVFCANWFSVYAQQDDAARKILSAAIKAHGGKERILKLRIAKLSYSSSFNLPGKGEASVEVEDSYQLPKQFKKVTKGKLNGKVIELTWAVVENGRSWWSREGNGVTQFHNEPRDIENLYRPFLILEQLVLAYDSKNTSLKVIEELKDDKRVLLGVRMSILDNPTVDLFFDKQTGLLAKIDNMKKLPGATDLGLLAGLLSEYKTVNGAVLYHKITSFHQGKKVAEIQVTAVETFEQLDDKIFAAP